MKAKKVLHLFLYHKKDELTKSNYLQLCKFEGSGNVQPISDCQSYLPNTYRADEGSWEFPHWDSYWMCDGLIYKYVLNNESELKKREIICINEYDTWWQCHSSEWMPDLMSKCDIAASNILEFGKNNWVFFDKHKDIEFAQKLKGMVPFSVICVKPATLIKIAKLVRDDERFHKLYNNEMRIATAANMVGAKMLELPHKIKKNIQWHSCSHNSEKSVFHPIKNIITPKEYIEKETSHKRVIKHKSNEMQSTNREEEKNIKKERDLFVFTSAFYGNVNQSLTSVSRLKNSVERFDIKLNVLAGDVFVSLQDAKIHKLLPYLESINNKWVMWIDGGDTYCVQDPRESINHLNKCGKQILMSAEMNCWPDSHLHVYYPNSTENVTTMKNYRFLNSGVFVGRRLDVIRHLKLLEQIMKQDISLQNPARTDQAVWSKLFLEQKKYGASISLDYKCNLSISTIGISDSVFSCGSRNGKECIKITETQGKPIVLHFNGNDKHNTDRINRLTNIPNNCLRMKNGDKIVNDEKNSNNSYPLKRLIKRSAYE
jgi:hypothetical protein